MNLCDLLKQSLASQETGQLVVKFEDVAHLCKISIEQGQAVFIQLGTMGPEETLGYITHKKPTQANFIPGVPPRRKLDSPLNEALCAIAQMHVEMWDEKRADQGKPKMTVTQSAEKVPVDQVSLIVSDFIDLVGPLGGVLAEKVLRQLGYRKDQPVGGNDYARFIQDIAQEIPDEDRHEFLRKYAQG